MIDPAELAEMQKLVDEMVQSCAEDPDALSCAIETLEGIPDSLCKPTLYLFTQEDCGVCEEDREKYGELLQQGTVKELDAGSPEGSKIMNDNNLALIPTLALIDCEGKVIFEIYDSNIDER